MSDTQPRSNEQPKGARDRMRDDPNPVFADRILKPLFELNSRHNFTRLIAAHRAWITMLAEKAIVPRERAASVLYGLAKIEQEGPDALRPFDPVIEYYYLHMERALCERAPGGESSVGNLNLGRTRPEPLARMLMRDALIGILKGVLEFRGTLLKRAEAEINTVMPGYTHLQHAQPTTLGHYLLAIQDHLERDTKRLLAAYDTTDRCTLGCGAMSGTSLPIDRERVRQLLGFAALCENTIDSVSASDHVTEAASALAGLMTIIGRVSQDLYIWSSQEFAMIDVTDSFSSPSSLMPQKKNALVLEYIRSRTARTVGALTGCFTVLHNVGYMDTEEVEIEVYRPLLDAIALTEEALPTITAVVSALQPNRDLMRARTGWGFSVVTALAEEIHTRTDLSNRTAHRIVARAVRLAVEAGEDASGINSDLLDRAAEEILGRKIQIDPSVIAECIDPDRFIHRHTVIGGPAPQEVRRMAAERWTRLARDEQTITERQDALVAGEELLRGSIARIDTKTSPATAHQSEALSKATFYQS